MVSRIAILLAAAMGVATALVPSEPAEVTFRKHIAPILAAKCVSCHSPGGAGPFSLLTYEDARKRADLIENVAMLQKMPPTRAQSTFGEICLDQRLTDGEVMQIQEWNHSHAPEGSVGLAKIPAPDHTWRLGPPDLIVKSTETIVVPPEGDQVTKFAVVEVPTTENRDLIAFDIRPNTPGAARRAILATEDPLGRSAFSDKGITANRMIGVWAIGALPWHLPDNAGLTLPPQAKLRVRMLYHQTGKREDGGFQIGLYFAKTPRPQHPEWITLGRTDFELSGKEPYYTDVTSSAVLPKSSRIISIVPEARELARTVSLRAKLQEWERSVLLISPWDWRWAGAYNFDKPPVIPAGATLESSISYYNSTHDDPSLTMDEIKRLPPNKSVFYGGTDKDELCWLHIQVVSDK